MGFRRICLLPELDASQVWLAPLSSEVTTFPFDANTTVHTGPGWASSRPHPAWRQDLTVWSSPDVQNDPSASAKATSRIDP